MGYKLETTALISIDNYNAFRITRIMLILDFLNATEPLFLIKKLENYLVFILCFQLEVINNFVNISFEIKNVFS